MSKYVSGHRLGSNDGRDLFSYLQPSYYCGHMELLQATALTQTDEQGAVVAALCIVRNRTITLQPQAAHMQGPALWRCRAHACDAAPRQTCSDGSTPVCWYLRGKQEREMNIMSTLCSLRPFSKNSAVQDLCGLTARWWGSRVAVCCRPA